MKLRHLHLSHRWRKLSLEMKVILPIVLSVVIVGGLVGFAQFQDWRNEQFLRDIVADFNRLEAGLEKELGVDVEDESGCFTTSEKFGEGKTGCFAKVETTKGGKDVRPFVFSLLGDVEGFDDPIEFRNGGFSLDYKDWPCVLFFDQESYSTTGLECPVPVRAGNSDLVHEIF